MAHCPEALVRSIAQRQKIRNPCKDGVLFLQHKNETLSVQTGEPYWDVPAHGAL
jgi:hypothetical protein